MSFSETLRALRFSYHKTQKALAEVLHVPESTYRSWESGKCLPSYKALDNIVHTLIYACDLSTGAQYAHDLQNKFNIEKAGKGKHKNAITKRKKNKKQYSDT